MTRAMYTMSSPRPARAMSILRLVGRESAPAPGRLPPCRTSRCLSSKRECARSASCSRPTKCAPEGEPWVWRSALFVRCIAKVVLTANGPARLPQLCAPPINRRLPALICRLAKLLRYRLLAFFAVFGPGFITANVDNDPGGILTYSQAGAKFGCIAVDSNRLWFRWGPTSAGTSTQGSHKILRLISKGGR